MAEKPTTFTKPSNFLRRNLGMWIALLGMILLPFIVGLFEGATPGQVWANETGISKFVQGLGIEIFILALYALSYDLIFGITGLLSFGHSMFFATGAYLTGILLKSFSMPLGITVLLVISPYCFCCLVNIIFTVLLLLKVLYQYWHHRELASLH